MGTSFRRVLLGVVSAATVLALTVPGAALAKGPGGGEETLGKSLAVPAVFVGENPYGLTCDVEGVSPSGDPATASRCPATTTSKG
jgi:hypothetical protein